MRFLSLPLLLLSGCAHRAPAETAGPGRISLHLEMTEVHVALSEIARKSGANLVYQGSFSRLVSVTLHYAPWRDAVEAVARTCDLDVDWDLPGMVLVTGR